MKKKLETLLYCQPSYKVVKEYRTSASVDKFICGDIW